MNMKTKQTCRCHRKTIEFDAPDPYNWSLCARLAIEAGWISGVPDPILHPDEVHAYCSTRCRDMDAALVRHHRPMNYRSIIGLYDLDPDDLHGALRAADGVEGDRVHLVRCVTWLLENPAENERGKRHLAMLLEERRACKNRMEWLVRRADRIKRTEQALLEGRTIDF